MSEIERGLCYCKDCEEKRAKLQRQLDAEFYKETDKFREDVKLKTLEKAAEKYNEPFNPDSWTNEQLAWHAMAENYDQSNYINGMFDRMKKQEAEIARLAVENTLLKDETKALTKELQAANRKLKAYENTKGLDSNGNAVY